MTVFSALALATLVSFSPQFDRGRDRNQNGRDRVCVYQDIHYQGWEQCYAAGDEVSSLQNRKNAISSIRVYGRARVTVYDDTEFRGRSAEFTSDVPDLGSRNLNGSKSWSDRIQSLRISSDNTRYSSYGYPDQQVNEGICVYDRPDYEGRSQCWSAGETLNDLARAGNWSDKISSIRVYGRPTVMLYRDIQYGGDSIVIDRDVPDLSQLSGGSFRNWNRQISSIQIDSSRGGSWNRQRRYRR